MLDLDSLKFTFKQSAQMAVYPPGATFGPRLMHDYEWVWILDGRVTWHCDNQAHAVSSGALILSQPGMQEFYQWDPQRQTRHAFLHFGLTMPKSAQLERQKWPRIRLPESESILFPLFRHMALLLNQPRKENEALVQTAARLLLGAFLSGAMQTEFESSEGFSAPVRLALEHLQAGWEKGPAKPCSLPELAVAAHVSVGHLCRLFREELGCGPAEVARKMRLDRAAVLLARTNLRIKEIALQTGFESPFHFSRCFRALYAAAPMEFRQQARLGTAHPRSNLNWVGGVAEHVQAGKGRV